MLSIDVSHAASFLPLPYEAALRPRLERAAGWLQNGGGKGSDFIGWVTLPRDYDKDEYARILAAAKKIQGDSKALVVIGIGGSYLGARGVIECLCSPNYNLKKKSTPNIYFIGNGLSSDALREVTELIGDDDFSVNVISKSGTTTEPAVAFRFFREKLEKKYGKAEAAKRIYATTDAHKGALKSLADQEGYEEFVVPDNIGGRYSVLTAVGLLPIAVAGVDLDELMGGAQEMMTLCTKNDYSNPAWQYAAARNALYAEGKLIELLVGERVRLINDHQVKIGTRSHLAAGQRTHRAKTNAGLRNVKRHRLASLLPQLFEAIHGQIRTSLTFRRTIAVHAVGIRLTYIHETLFKTINR